MKKTVCFLLAILTVALTACNKIAPAASDELPQAAYLIDEAIIDNICVSLQKNGLHNVDVFKVWVKDFAGTSAEKTDLPKQWVKLADLRGDTFACADRWEETHDYPDADCRMTAMLLMGDLLKVDRPKKSYDGTYLMMDVDAIENADKYRMIQERETDFTTLFGEIPIPDAGIAQALPQNWEEHGISFNSESASLISVVMEDTMSPTAFVGHAGILLDEGDSLLFIEKLAFEQPYQVTRLRNTDELIKMLSARPEYAAEDGKEPSVICRNNAVIGRIISEQNAGC